MKIRFAVTPPQSALEETTFPRYLEECEQLGFDTVWLSDIPLGPLGDPLISLAYAAAHTRRLKLGANLVPLGRHPLWLAKQLAQVDRLSQGRLLISFVPGLGSAAERHALGYVDTDRSTGIDDMLTLMRRWWSGEAVTGEWHGLRFDEVAVTPRPVQQPLEIWFGGISKSALERVARLADGWLTSAATPAEAGAGRASIERRAAELGRTVDADHFGISVPFSRDEPAEETLTALRERRKDRDLRDIVAVGAPGLRALSQAHIDAGISKFVVRPLTALSHASPWRDDLHWLADAVLPLQT